MARIGMNPARNRISDYRPARVTVAVLVYIPYLEGYFEHRLEVLKMCLASIANNTEEPHDLLIFDNGSCEAAKSYLQGLVEEGVIQYLFTSTENIGKIGAFKLLFQAAPGEIVAYCDDDIFHYRGWLKEHLRILEAYPEAGMISGCAVRTLFDHGTQSNQRLAESDPSVALIRGQNTPDLWEREWAESYGRDPERHLMDIQTQEDLMLERDGFRVFAVANHNQFLIPKDIILQCLPEDWSGRLMGEMNELDNAVDQAGYLRLSTPERTTKHIGNTVSPALRAEAEALGIKVDAIQPSVYRKRRIPFSRRLLKLKPVQWVLQGIYNRLFWILSDQSGQWLEITPTDET
jgi:glycosyltransferase involved in cell wall biosynthesis